MSDERNWYDELEPGEAQEVYRLLAQSEGSLRSALAILNGRGDPHRDDLAESYSIISHQKVAFDGARKLLEEDDD